MSMVHSYMSMVHSSSLLPPDTGVPDTGGRVRQIG